MDSMPPATTISDSPRATACAASPTALRPEPQTLLMAIAETRESRPPRSAAWRAGFWPSPAWTSLPMMASSTCLGSRPARLTDSVTTLAPNSGAERGESPPINLPIGVRTALRMTGVSMVILLQWKDQYRCSDDWTLEARGKIRDEKARNFCD